MKIRYFRNDSERRAFVTNLDNWDLFDWRENVPIKQYSLEIDGAEFVIFCPLCKHKRKDHSALVTAFSEPFADPVPIYKTYVFHKGSYSQKGLEFEYTLDQVIKFMREQEKEHEQERFSGNG